MDTSGALERGSNGVARSLRPEPVVAGVLALAVVFNLWVTRGQLFFSDEWSRLILDNGASFSELLRGHSGHLVILHSLLYKGLFAVFGADSYLPFRILHSLLVGLAGLLFFGLVRSETRPWPAVFATSLLVLLGSAWEVLSTPWGTIILLPVVLGLAALLLIRHGSAVADLLACLLLIGAVSAQSTGLAFLAGAACALLLGAPGTRVRRSWIFLVPLAIYAAWFVWSRSTGVGDAIQDPVHAGNVIQVPSAMASVAAAGLTAGTGFFGESRIGEQSFNLTAGYLLLGFAVLGVAWRGRRQPPPGGAAWVGAALALAFWGLVAFVVEPPFRPPEAARYLFPSVLFLLLIALELARGIPLGRAAGAAAGAAFAVALVPNAANLVRQGNGLRTISADERVALGTLELMRGEIPPERLPGLSTIEGPAITFADPGQFTASQYFAAAERYGSPATAPDRLIGATDFQRLAVDRVLLDRGEIGVLPVPKRVSARAAGCRRPGSGGEIELPDGPILLVPAGRGAVTIMARRFGATFQSPAGGPWEGGVAVAAPFTPGTPGWRLRVGPGVLACAAPGA